MQNFVKLTELNTAKKLKATFAFFSNPTKYLSSFTNSFMN